MYAALAQLLIVAALIADTVLVFSHLQDPETGTFAVTQLTEGAFAGSWRMAAVIVTGVALIGAAALLAVYYAIVCRAKKEENAHSDEHEKLDSDARV